MGKATKAPYCNVFVRRGLNEETLKTVLTHEIILLAAVHGDDAIRMADEQPDQSKNVDPDAEYARLEAVYGSPKGDDTPYITAIYGMRMGKAFQRTVGAPVSDFLDTSDDEDEEDADPVVKKTSGQVKKKTSGKARTVSKKDCVLFLKGASVPDIDEDMSADEMREFTMATAVQIAGALEISVPADVELADLIDAIKEATDAG